MRRNDRVEIAEKAYELWGAAGHPGGRDLEFWLQAEAELEAAEHHRNQKPSHLESGQRRDAAQARPYHSIPRNREAAWRYRTARHLY
jgi:hypothetical protein